MEFNIKKENRKKFQDKTKLNRHHKKNYAKVVKPTDKPEEESLISSSEDEIQYDEEGNPIELSSDEDEDGEENQEPQLDENGNVIPKPARRRKKLQSNAWRYREELEDDEFDQAEINRMLKDIDFKKLSIEKAIDLGGNNKKIDIKKMSLAELEKLKITDKSIARPEMKAHQQSEPQLQKNSQSLDDDFLDDLLTAPVKIAEPQTIPSYSNKTPTHLKDDEAFLDDLL